jgi:hypothetical protein
MRYLKYFESVTKLFQIINKEDIVKFMELYKIQDATENMVSIISSIINDNKLDILRYDGINIELYNEQHKSIKISLGDTVVYISIFEDEYFIVLTSTPDLRTAWKIPRNIYYKVDGWDGLEQLLRLLY